MLTRKSITLLNSTADLAPVISRNQLAMQQRAEAILQQAQQQSAKIVAAAEQEAEVATLGIRQRAEEVFWSQADKMFTDWQQQQQQMESDMLLVMDSVLTQALEQLLEEVPEQQRLSALLRQLLREKTQAEQAAYLSCHPSQQQWVSAWLETYSHLRWQLQPDETLPPDSLKLVTAQGELSLDWQQATRLLKPSQAQ
jgi:type III secretion protein L